MDAESHGVKPVFDWLKPSGHLFGRIALIDRENTLLVKESTASKTS